MRRLLLSLSVLGVLVGVLTAPPASAGPVVTVTWPAVTSFNPAVTTYEVVVDDPVGGGVLVAWWGERSQVVASHGPTALTFPEPVIDSVRLSRCATAKTPPYTCEFLSSSPEIKVFDRLDLVEDGLAQSTQVRPGVPAHRRFRVWPSEEDLDVSATWDLVRPDGSSPPGASGAATAVVVDGTARLPFTVPLGTPEGTYRLRVRVSATLPDFGPLAGTLLTSAVSVDATAPHAVPLDEPPAVFHPVRDRYQDEWRLVLDVDEPTSVDLAVRDTRGELAAVRRFHGRGTVRVVWNGTSRDRQVVPQGRYVVTLVAKDAAGNIAAARTYAVRVSDRQRQRVTYRRTVSATDSLSSKSVGSCSSLTRGARGSLRLASATRCGRGGDDAAVVTTHGIYVPRALGGSYQSLRVTLHGGPATGSPRDYVVQGYHRGRRGFVSKAVFRRGRTHAGPRAWARPLVFDRGTRRPFVLWSTGLAAGSRYDVRSFTVELTHDALVRTGHARPATAAPRHAPPVR